MSNAIRGGLLVLITTLTGCNTVYQSTSATHTPYPIAQSPEKSFQTRIQSAAHWDTLAQHEAEMIAKGLGHNAHVSFSDDADQSQFGKAYQKMLTEHLIAQGIFVYENGGDYELRYQAQVVKHEDRGFAFVDFDTSTPPSEVIMTTELLQGKQIVQSSTQTYYFKEGDTNHYTVVKPTAKGTRFNLTNQQ